MASIYDQDLEQNQANYQPLTPLTFLERAATVFPERIASDLWWPANYLRVSFTAAADSWPRR